MAKLSRGPLPWLVLGSQSGQTDKRIHSFGAALSNGSSAQPKGGFSTCKPNSVQHFSHEEGSQELLMVTCMCCVLVTNRGYCEQECLAQNSGVPGLGPNTGCITRQQNTTVKHCKEQGSEWLCAEPRTWEDCGEPESALLNSPALNTTFPGHSLNNQRISYRAPPSWEPLDLPGTPPCTDLQMPRVLRDYMLHFKPWHSRVLFSFYK